MNSSANSEHGSFDSTHSTPYIKHKEAHSKYLREFLREKKHLISKQQGFVRNVDDIERALVRFYEPTGIRMKDARGNPALKKKMTKLILSLRRHVVSKFPWVNLNTEHVSYHNLFTDYNLGLPSFSEPELETWKSTNEVDLKGVLELESTESTGTEVYKPICSKPLRNEILSMEQVLRKLRFETIKESGLSKGKKFVDTRVKYKFTLNDKFRSESDKVGALYQVYLNWFNAKVIGHSRRAEITYYVFDQMQGNKSVDKYLISKDLFQKYLLGQVRYAKRFGKIMKFCQSVYKGEAVNNNGVVERMVHNSTMKEDRPYKFKFAAKFSLWYNNLVKDLQRRGFLNSKQILMSKCDNTLFNPDHKDMRAVDLKWIILNSTLSDLVDESGKRNLMKAFNIMPKSRVFRYGFLLKLQNHVLNSGFLNPVEASALRGSKFMTTEEYEAELTKVREAKKASERKIITASEIYNIYLDLVKRGYLKRKESIELFNNMDCELCYPDDKVEVEGGVWSFYNPPVKPEFFEGFLKFSEFKPDFERQVFSKPEYNYDEQEQLSNWASKLHSKTAGRCKIKDPQALFAELLKKINKREVRKEGDTRYAFEAWAKKMFDKKVAKSLDSEKAEFLSILA